MKTNLFWFTALISLISASCAALEYDWPQSNDSRLLGDNYIHTVFEGEHLADIADQYDVGFLSLLSANHDIDPYLLKPESFLVIPQKLSLVFKYFTFVTHQPALILN